MKLFATSICSFIDNTEAYIFTQAKTFYNELFLLAIRICVHNKSFRSHVASFCATGNNRFSLTDDSGNLRWLPFYIN
ncbi:MAG: hypothetical protein RR319_06925 [Bacteroides sp.]